MSHITWHPTKISKQQRSSIKSQKPCLLWFTGLSGSGKSTIANAVDECLHSEGYHTYVLDGDNVRRRLNKDLGFSEVDRVENIRRIGEVSNLFVDAGMIVLSAFISPFESDRILVRNMLENSEFVEVYVNTPLEVCENRDPKGLYKEVRAGRINNFTGISSPYESPTQAEIEIKTAELSIEECAEKVIRYMVLNGLIHKISSD